MKRLLSKDKLNYWFNWVDSFYIKTIYFYSSRIYPIMKTLFVIASLLSLGILIYEYGYENITKYSQIQNLVRIIINYFLFYEFLNLFFYRFDSNTNIYEYFKKRKFEIIFAFLVLIFFLFENFFIHHLDFLEISKSYIVLIYLTCLQIFILINNFLHFSRNISNIRYKKINPSLVFLISFLFLIFIGTILLSSPNVHNKKMDLIDIIFTVVSATCVTGLSTIDVGKDLNLAGQIILLSLIQIGGLGLMTLTSFFTYYLSGQVSLTNQIVMKELFNEVSLDKVKNNLRDITIFTFIIESMGALYLYFTLPDSLIPIGSSKIFYAIFHSISAFCNAGFSLFPDSLYSVSQISPLSIYGIMFLIMFGGIGFPVIKNLGLKIINKKQRIHLTTKIVLLSNLILWLSGFFVFIFFSSFFNFNLNLKEKILHGLFFSITPRTAGFNTLSYQDFPIPLIFFTFLLMWIGASPVSTGGGIKTTTITIALFHIIFLLRGNRKIEVFNRRISEETIIRAYTNVLLSLMTIFLGIFLLSIFEQKDFLKIAFEVVSAYGTVGLSLGITTELHPISKMILCFIMLTGRIGILSLLLAIIPKAKELKYEYPTEYVVVG